jgi:LmbE family N-acetylglucosaminyl deacetylase
VHVIFMTSGDGFKFGVTRYYKKLTVGPSDFKSYGEMRMSESRNALATVGLASGEITFLGYPDRGMMAIWREHWNADDPFKSPYSQSTKVVYENAYHPNAPFCATSVLADLIDSLRASHPTDVYVTHPNDDHDDHSATSAFTLMAVEMLRASGEPWARHLKLHYYLVHRGDWPVPQGVHPDAPLCPPAQMMACGTSWRRLPLTASEEAVKREAIGKYDSQEEMMGRFLKSFVRRNELFGDTHSEPPTIATERLGAYQIDGSSATWPNVPPLEQDPTGDNVVISLQRGGDIKLLSAYQDSKNLFVRMDMNGSLLPEVRYVIHLRAVDMQGHSTAKETAITFDPRTNRDSAPKTLRNGAIAAWHQNTIEMQIPLSLIDAPTDGFVFLEGVTHFSQVPFDRTGPRAIRIHTGDVYGPVKPLT